MDIEKLLKPERLAIIGASEKEGFGGDTSRNAIRYMEKGRYFFVNPKREELFGQPCYPTIDKVPERVDLVVICTPLQTVENLLRESAAVGVRAAVVFASGYSEIGTEEGRKYEESLKSMAEILDMAVMGPNCAGYINFVNGASSFAFLSEERERKGGVGFVSQSGQLALSMMDSPQMKFSYAISSGNSTVCTMEDYMDFLIEDETTRVVAMYLEGVRNTDHFIAALKKAALKKKPIVILKTGRSAKGQEIAASHTGSLSGTDKVYDALFKKFGVIRVDDLEELMSTCMALATLKELPKTGAIASMNLSGGETGICADLGEINAIPFTDFLPETLESLNEQLPDYASPNNPLDMTATLSYDSEKYGRVLKTVMDDPGVGMIAVGYTLLQEVVDPAIHYMCEGMEQVCSRPGSKPVVMLPFAENTRNKEYSRRLEEIGVPVLSTSNYAFKVIRNILDFAAYRCEDFNLDIKIPESSGGEAVALSEWESRKILEEYGIPFPPSTVVQDTDRIKDVADSLGYPLVAKVDSPDIMHKSDAGCVKLNLNNTVDVLEAFKEISNNARAYNPEARINGVQITCMAKSGTEIIIGIKNDPQFGPCILCGLGGVFVEVFKDTALSLAPVSPKEAASMIHSLKGSKVLKGYRGSDPADIEALIETIVKVSEMASEHREELQELDLNPVFLYDQGICAVDALYVRKK